jgi:WD40 repeat protein
MHTFALFLFAAAAEPAPIKVVPLDRQDPVSYEKEIEPILAAKCAGCHSGKARRGKYDLGTYPALMKGGKTGTAVVPGKAADSLLVQLAGRTKDPVMPPGKKNVPLTPEELAVIKLWIDQGAKGPAPGMIKPKAAVKLGSLPAGVHPVRALAINPDKSILAVGRGNQVQLFEPTRGKVVRSLAGLPAIVDGLAFAPDGKTLAAGSFREVVLWDPANGDMRHRLTGFADRVVAVAFSPDGRLLATGGGPAAADGEVRLFDAATGSLVRDFAGAHADTVYGVAFSPDGTKLATCGADKLIKTWDVATGKPLKTFEGHTNYVLDVAWKADGKLLASAGADTDVKIWDVTTGEQARSIKGHGKQVTRLAFVGSSANLLTAGGDATARLWNGDSGAAVRTFGGGADFLNAVTASADGSVIATGSEDGVVRVYAGDGKLIRSLEP